MITWRQCLLGKLFYGPLEWAFVTVNVLGNPSLQRRCVISVFTIIKRLLHVLCADETVDKYLLLQCSNTLKVNILKLLQLL